MARRKREPMSEGKKNLIAELIEMYDSKTEKDIENALKDLMGSTIQEMLDAVHFSVRDNEQIEKLAAYVILAVSLTGHKEVLSIHIGENESAEY